jgi:hypothetical protein
VGLSVSADSAAVVVALAALGFWAYCLYDFARTDERDMRTFSRPVWVLLLVFASIFGALLWLAYGRPQRR